VPGLFGPAFFFAVSSTSRTQSDKSGSRFHPSAAACFRSFASKALAVRSRRLALSRRTPPSIRAGFDLDPGTRFLFRLSAAPFEHFEALPIWAAVRLARDPAGARALHQLFLKFTSSTLPDLGSRLFVHFQNHFFNVAPSGTTP
jgi:hypothetical protein